MLSLYMNGVEHVNLDMYTVIDVIGFVVLFFINVMFFRVVCNCIVKKKMFEYVVTYKNTTGIWKKRNWILISVVIFFAWLPYLISNYPGFILGDSLISIGQAVGERNLNNHHPILYTFYIKGCLALGEIIKDRTFGCCIYSILQMIYLSLGIGYMIMWIRKKGAPKFLCILFTAYFSFTPYYAQISIAMWKDPVFSLSVALISVLLFDLVISKGKIAQNKMFWFKYVFFTILMCFTRNNGLYIVLFCELFIVIYTIIYKNKEFKKVSICTGVLIGVIWIITGPIYEQKKLSGEPVEKLGVFLNQMARVVVYDGNMSKKEKEFMDNLLPLEKYHEAYRPATIDSLKWHDDFSQKYLDSHLDDFTKNYFTMMIKNPGIYFESWQLGTFGYWAFNYWPINNCDSNIELGSMKDILVYDYGLDKERILKNIFVPEDSLFSYRGKNISLGIVTWVILFLVCIVIIKRWEMMLPLAPVLGLLITLLIASPVAVWGRYGLAECYLIPFYFIVFIFALKGNENRLEEK